MALSACSSVLTIHNSLHLEKNHELSCIKDALEILLGTKCSFFVSQSHRPIGLQNKCENETDGLTSSKNQPFDSVSWDLFENESSQNKDQESKVEQIQKQSYQTQSLELTISFESDVSSADLTKAKNFVKTHLAFDEAAEYTVRSHSLATPLVFDMVHQRASSIQSETFALLTFDTKSKKNITIQGPEKSVRAGLGRIRMLLNDFRERETGPYLAEDCYNKADQLERETRDLKFPAFIKGTAMPPSDPICVLPEGTVKGQDDNMLTTSMGNKGGLINTDKKVTNLEKISTKLDFGDLIQDELDVIDDESSFTSTSSSDDEDARGRNILDDVRYTRHVEMGLKLDYTEEQVAKALERLGLDCGTNDLLSELIAMSRPTSVSGKPVQQHLEAGPQANVINGSSSNQSTMSYSSFRSSAEGSITASPLTSVVDDKTDKPSESPDLYHSSNLRHIIIDGSNVAMSHGKKYFSCRGIKIAVDWFKERGHKYITAFVPKWRKESSRPDALIKDQELLVELERENIVVFTPARRVKGKRVVCYDDRYILKLAVETDGIVVSNDVYRDLVSERDDFRRVVDSRLLMYTFVNDRFMPPEDPLGRTGPTLDNFLRKIPIELRPRPPDCPWAKRCTYGNKCRFYHPERGFAHQKSVTQAMKEHAEAKLQERANKLEQIDLAAERGRRPKQKLVRTRSLVPGSSLSSSGPDIPLSVLDPSSNNVRGSEKPKLSHSLSVTLGASSSTRPDYLDEARRKFEQAELVLSRGHWSNPLPQSSSGSEVVGGSVVAKSSVSPHMITTPPPSSQSGMSSSILAPSLVPSHCASFPDLDLDEECALYGTSALVTALEGSGLIKLSQEGLSGSGIKKTSLSESTGSQRVSPSHLTVDQREPYVSGHLALAQKLSDEGSDSNFFSEHTAANKSSAASSPRNVSPAGPRQHKRSTEKEEEGGVSKYSPGHTPNQIPPSFLGSPQADSLDVPNLSIFNQQSLQSMASSQNDQKFGYSTDRFNISGMADGSYELSSDSGLSMLSPPSVQVNPGPFYQTNLQHSASMHSVSEGHFFPQKLHGVTVPAQQQFSHTFGPSNTELKLNPGSRRQSDVISTTTKEHMPLRARLSVPEVAFQHHHLRGHADMPAALNAPHMAASLSRQNSTSDPQLHTPLSHPAHQYSESISSGIPYYGNPGFDNQTLLSLAPGDQEPPLVNQTGRFQHPNPPSSFTQDMNSGFNHYSEEAHHYSNQYQTNLTQFPSDQSRSMSNLQTSMYGNGRYADMFPCDRTNMAQTPYQMDTLFGQGQPPSFWHQQQGFASQYNNPIQHLSNPPSEAKEMYSLHPTSMQGLNHTFSNMTQFQHTQPPPGYGAGPQQYFSSQVMSEANRSRRTSFHQSFGSSYHQSTQPLFNQSNSPLYQQSNSSLYHQSNVPLFNQPNTMSYRPPSFAQAAHNPPQVLPENAPIQPTDPRYSLYCNLCTAFNEKIVRTVMNQHPNVLNAEEVINNIQESIGLKLQKKV